MADHGTETDARAEAALDALRQGRPVPDRQTARRGVTVGLLLDRIRAAPPVAIVAAAGIGVALLLTVGWLGLRSGGGAPLPRDDALFAAPSTTALGGAAGGLGPATTTSTTAAPADIVVHAAGAVVSPGVFPLPPGSRVGDLLERAGGPTPDADLDRLNLAAPLADGQRLYVPRQGEASPSVVAPDGGTGPSGSVGAAPAGSGPGGAAPTAPIDLNHATVDELDALPGVGPATAAAIVDHRERNGPFASVDALLDVRGIGPAKLEALRDLVVVG